MRNKLFFLLAVMSFQQNLQAQTKNLIIVFDGLRPDYIKPEIMPNLYRFKQDNSYGDASHSVFPCVTRVNSSAYATGSYPWKTGLLGNNVYLPMVDSARVFNTGNARDLMTIDSATNGHLLTTRSLGEILRDHGQKMFVFSSGSTGQAMLQNHTVNGAIINPLLILPASLKEDVINTLGKPSAPNHEDGFIGVHRWATDALFHYGLSANGPEVSAIWYADPDETAHATGVGSPETIKALAGVDQQFQRILDTLEARHMIDQVNIIITSDHGFITNGGTEDGSLTGLLIQNGWKKSKTSTDVVAVDGAIFVKDHDPVIIRKIVEALQQQSWVGPIFTNKGKIKGTLSFDVIHWGHPDRAADILMASPWNDKENTWHFAGTSERKGPGASHGGLSPYEIHIPLILSGPAFKKRYVSNLPTANVDIVPTILKLRNIPVPAVMDGRVMEEYFTGQTGKGQPVVKKEIVKVTAQFDWGTYELEASVSRIGAYYYYFDHAQAKRKYKKAD
ncbi:sulfatase-like hydrolase/transferase [Chitinophaga sp. SYP-B3965]|uniref:alkaline phosphatase family protein n=1 Tax=Chitinophaga sp. SYP-B3965 TaxID=2663120 RepID=UPI0012995832|nr:alkaline phosphatase family protein [Chitinophaga sp. SYP-B3965]MRG44015.1 sulfatase-like hydrolase/transferase [Chitinophaga sp. SYP-B3965]